MAVQRQLDRFKFSLAIVDVLGIIAFFWTSQWVILVYLALFNFLIILVDVIRRGMVVRPETEPAPLPDEIPVDPVTGNLYAGDLPRAMPEQKPVPQPRPMVRNVPAAVPFSRKAEDPFAGIEGPKAAAPQSVKDPKRKEIEDALEEWVTK